ncbi:glutamate-ammonia-ligase adenylyltransferase [bacterium BMS3Abin04]|nr:glutamate-ammonia-ligase adenylyltransferase [bacterium BMS3Abin04]
MAIEPTLLQKLQTSKQPDRVIENFAKVIERIKFPSIWYNEFRNEKFFVQFLNICESAQKAIDLLLWDFSLPEFFLSRSVFQKNIEKNLSEFTINQILFLLSVQFSLDLLNTERFSKILTIFLNNNIIKYFKTKKLNYPFFIGGLGSFGTYDMNFESDIDLIVVTKNIASHPYIQNDLQQFLKDINAALDPFKVDFRLRPEGKGSPLVWDIKDYISYLDKRARVWEFQALTKIRFVLGDKELFNEFVSGAGNSLNRFEVSKILSESNEMYKKILNRNSRNFSNSFDIKKSKGSLLTIDFILQFLILQRKSLNAFLDKNTINRIDKLQDFNYSNIDLNRIKVNYVFLKTFELVNQNIFATRTPSVPNDMSKLDLLASKLGIKSGDGLIIKIKNIAVENHSLYEKIFS